MTGRPTLAEVSVVIPAFNAEATLGEQLEALSRQQVPFAWEVLVCDNGSTDGTVRVAREWQSRLPQLRLLDASARRGPGAARNVGAANASGIFLLFCDADDVVADDWVVELHRGVAQHDLVAGASRRPELNSKPGKPVYFDFSTYRMPFLTEIPVAGAANLGVRKSVFDRVSGFDEFQPTGEDVDLCWRIQFAGYPLVVQPTATVTVRNRPDLMATFKQAYRYGMGDRRLRRKYVRLIEASHQNGDERAGLEEEVLAYRRVVLAAPAAPPVKDSSPAARQEGPGLAHRTVSKLTSIRRPSDLMNLASKFGAALGSRFGSVGGSVAPLDFGSLTMSDGQ